MDEDGFRVLFDEHVTELWRFARRRCASATEADDVVADTFLVAWRRRPDIPEGEAARLWLFGCARRILANQRRSATRRHNLENRLRGLSLSSSPDGAEALLDGLDHPVLAALARLTPDDRDLLIMRAWDGLAVTDMAVLLDLTPNAVSLRLTKARARLAAGLGRTDPADAGQFRGKRNPTEGSAT
jgi:RNA polymerase sigma-70 factor, ECF subfamily